MRTLPVLPPLHALYCLSHAPYCLSQAVRVQLQQWATKALAAQHPDASPALVHQQLLQFARNRIPAPAKVIWFRLQLTPNPPEGDHLVSALYHLSTSRDLAWKTLMRVFWHGLAMPGTNAAGAEFGGSGWKSSNGGSSRSAGGGGASKVEAEGLSSRREAPAGPAG